MEKNLLNKAFEEFTKDTSTGLGDILMADFMMHLATTTISILLRKLIEDAKTPEEKEAWKTIPNQIVDGWEKSRLSEFVTGTDDYVKTLSENDKASFLTKENIEEVAKKFTEDEQRTIKEIALNLRKGFAAIKEAL